MCVCVLLKGEKKKRKKIEKKDRGWRELLFLAALFEDETLDVTDKLVVRGEVFGSVEDKELQFLVETRLAFRINHHRHRHFLLGNQKLDHVVDPVRVLVFTSRQHWITLLLLLFLMIREEEEEEKKRMRTLEESKRI